MTSAASAEGPATLVRAVLEHAGRLLPADAEGLVVMVAVSGGADSMVLWDILLRAHRWRVVAYHLDHALRDESHDDALAIAAAAEHYRDEGLDASTVIERADVAALARSWQCGIEAAGRRHRYERLGHHARACGAAAVATAHHRDDQAETVLMNLLRGTGETGMRGIPAVRPLGDVSLIRPLLPFTRARLRAFATDRSLVWREDASNDDERFRRNVIRHRVLPVLEAGAPGATAALVALADVPVEEPAPPLDRARGEIAVERLPSDACRRALQWRHLLIDLGVEPSRYRVRALETLRSADSGSAYRVGAWRFTRFGEVIAWELAAADVCPGPVAIAGPGTWRRGGQVLAITLASPPADPKTPPGESWLDADRLHFPLTWRLAAPGERWLPLGSPGRQTIAKYLSDRKVRGRARMMAAVVADADGVVWVPGYGVAERVRIGVECRRAIHGVLIAE